MKHGGRKHCVLKTLKVCTYYSTKTNKSPLVLWVKDRPCNYINFIKSKIKSEKVSSGFSIFCIHVMSLECAHDSFVIKYDIVSQEGNPLPSGLATTSAPPTAILCTAIRPRYLGEISEVSWQGQVQLFRFIVGEDPGKDGVLVQVVVCPPWTQQIEICQR